MTKIAAAYFDGVSARRHRVELIIGDDGQVRIDGDGIRLVWPYPQVRISARLGNTPRYIYLPDGGKCEIEDNDAIDEVVAERGGFATHRWLHRIESHWRYVALAVALAVGFGWGTIEFVVPWAAMQVAHAIPPEAESTMGEEGLQTMDDLLFEPSELSGDEQRRVHALFASITLPLRQARLTFAPKRQGLDLPTRLELRSSPGLGANAFALPGGIVVITDELVRLAEDDEELLAVMAHELGHLAHRHVLRGLIQSSMTALFVAVTLGDLSSVAGLSATLPTYLVDAKYSREFELEADRYAAEYLDRTGRSRVALSRMLRRLAEEHGTDEASALDYFSSHPGTQERVEALGSGD